MKIAQLILNWRHFSKLKSTYTDALVEQINPKTKRVHTNYSMVGASTGRLSSSNPVSYTHLTLPTSPKV